MGIMTSERLDQTIPVSFLRDKIIKTPHRRKNIKRQLPHSFSTYHFVVDTQTNAEANSKESNLHRFVPLYI